MAQLDPGETFEFGFSLNRNGIPNSGSVMTGPDNCWVGTTLGPTADERAARRRRTGARDPLAPGGRASTAGAVAQAAMKITAVKPILADGGHRIMIFVKVETDQPGLIGWGEATLEGKPRAVAGCIEDMEPMIASA
jgi:hypothetical protein